MKTSPLDRPLHTASILDAATDGRALTTQEAVHLLELDNSEDLQSLRQAAFEVCGRQTAKPLPAAFGYSLFLTNLCELEPIIYPYPKQPGETGAFILNIDEIDAVLELCQTRDNPHLTVSGGGFWPTLRIPGLEKPNVLKTYAHLLAHIREKCPTAQVSGFSPDEVDFLSVVSDHKPQYILELLKDHGLKTLESHQVGLLVNRVRKQTSPKLMTVKDWLDIAKLAAKLEISIKLKSEIGHLETLQERVQHLEAIRIFLEKHATKYAAKTDFKVFQSLSPQLLEHNPNTREEWAGAKFSASIDRFKWLAVSRLFLGEIIPLQQSFWQTESTDPSDEAKAGLEWGANTLGRTDALSYSHFLLGSQPKSWLFSQLNL